MNAVEKIEAPASHVPVVSETTAVLSMIERMARDPSIDMERLQRFMEMRKEIRAEEAEREFNEAMASVQGKMRAVAADANNSQTKSKYASYFVLDKAIRPIYSAAGLALSFDTEDSPKPEHIRIVCYVTRGQHTRKYKIDMAADGKGAKGGDVMTKTHAAGSASTYGQRYLLKMIFNIAVGDDDDGNAAGGNVKLVTQAQADTLIDLLEVSGKSRAAFLKWAKVEKVEDIAADIYESCVDAIKTPVAK